MRAIARGVGVAHRALFNHFPDRAAFEAALAACGFERLATALRAAASEQEFVRAYVAFALSQTGLYELMMRQPYAAFETRPGLRAAADQVISAALAILAPSHADPEGARRAVMRLWMLAHGGVSLHRSGVLRLRSDEAFESEFLRIAGLAEPECERPQALWPKPTEDKP